MAKEKTAPASLKKVEQDVIKELKEKNLNISFEKEFYLEKSGSVGYKLNLVENMEAKEIVERHIDDWHKSRSGNTEKLMDWALQTIISWGVVLFTAVFGMLELFPEIRLYSGNFGIWLTAILPFIYVGFLFALWVSIKRIGYLYEELRVFQNELPKEFRERFGEQFYKSYLNEKTFRLLAIFIPIIFVLLLIFRISWMLKL